MSTKHTAPQVGEVMAAEVRTVAVSFANWLSDGETLSGTPTVTASPSDLTIADPAVSTSALTINGVSTPIGEAVQFTVSTPTAGSVYLVTVQCNTSTGQVLQGIVQINGVDS